MFVRSVSFEKRDSTSPFAVAPGAELLRDPGGDAGRGVGLGDAEGLGLGALDVAVAGLGGLEGLHRGDAGLVLLAGLGGRAGDDEVEVEAAKPGSTEEASRERLRLGAPQ